MIKLFVRLRRTRNALGENGANRLEESDVVANAHGLIVRHRQREGLRQFLDRLQQPLLAIFLRQDVFLRGGQNTQSLWRRSGLPF